MRVKVNDFETNWQEFKQRFKEALEYSPDILVFPSTALRALKSGILAERSFMVKPSIESANLQRRTRFM